MGQQAKGSGKSFQKQPEASLNLIFPKLPSLQVSPSGVTLLQLDRICFQQGWIGPQGAHKRETAEQGGACTWLSRQSKEIKLTFLDSGHLERFKKSDAIGSVFLPTPPLGSQKCSINMFLIGLPEN